MSNFAPDFRKLTDGAIQESFTGGNAKGIQDYLVDIQDNRDCIIHYVCAQIYGHTELDCHGCQPGVSHIRTPG